MIVICDQFYVATLKSNKRQQMKMSIWLTLAYLLYLTVD